MPRAAPDRALLRAINQLARADVRANLHQMEIEMPLIHPVLMDGAPANVLNYPQDNLGDAIANGMQPRKYDKPMLFWGGNDVDPALYGRPKSDLCGGTHRKADEQEAGRMQICIDQGQPIIGICRGAQLLNVVNGGVLVQHVDGHSIAGEHPCIIDYGDDYLECTVSSTHHQMMVAHKSGIIVGKGPGTTGIHWNDVNTPYTYKYTTEVVYYPKTKSLCIQPHPEWMEQDTPFIKWINQFIKKEFDMEPLDFTHEEAIFLGR